VKSSYTRYDHETTVMFLRLLLRKLNRLGVDILPYVNAVNHYELNGEHGMTPTEIDKYNELLEKAKII
jgi:hypothetical protein